MLPRMAAIIHTTQRFQNVVPTQLCKPADRTAPIRVCTNFVTSCLVGEFPFEHENDILR